MTFPRVLFQSYVSNLVSHSHTYITILDPRRVLGGGRRKSTLAFLRLGHGGLNCCR